MAGLYVTHKELSKATRCAFCPKQQVVEDDTSFVIPDGRLLDNILIISEGNMTIDIGTTPGGTEIVNGDAITAGTPYIVTVAEYGSTIYITGIDSPTTIKFYLR